MKGSNLLFLASWVILLVVSAAIVSFPRSRCGWLIPGCRTR